METRLSGRKRNRSIGQEEDNDEKKDQLMPLKERQKKAVEYYQEYQQHGDFASLKQAIEYDNTNSQMIYSYIKSLESTNTLLTEKDETLLIGLSVEQIETLKLDDETRIKYSKNWKNEVKELIKLISLEDTKIKRNEILIGHRMKDIVFNQPISFSNLQILYYNIYSIFCKYDTGINSKGKYFKDFCDLIINQMEIDNNDETIYDLLVLFTIKTQESIVYTIFQFTEDNDQGDEINSIIKKLLKYKMSGTLVDDELIINPINYSINITTHSLDIIHAFISEHPSTIDYLSQRYNESLKNHYYVNDVPYLKRKLKTILQSKCIMTYYNSLKKYAKVEYIFKDDKIYNEVWDYIRFVPDYNPRNFACTNVHTLLINVNSIPRTTFSVTGLDIKYSTAGLLNISTILLTLLHEVFGHFMKRYIYFATGTTKLIHSGEKEKYIEGGVQMEKDLFGTHETMTIRFAFFLLANENWNKDYKSFQKEYKAFMKKNPKEIFDSSELDGVKEIMTSYKIKNEELIESMRHNDHIKLKSCDDGESIELGECEIGKRRRIEDFNKYFDA